jgi:hypothetical protein
MLESLDWVIGLLKLHSHAIFRPGVSFLSSPRIAPKSFLLIGSEPELSKLEPHSAHELCLGMVLIGQETHYVHGVNSKLMLDLRCNWTGRM